MKDTKTVSCIANKTTGHRVLAILVWKWLGSQFMEQNKDVAGSNPACSQTPIKPSVGGDKVCAEALICILLTYLDVGTVPEPVTAGWAKTIVV